MTRSWRVVPDCCFRKCLAGKAFLQDSRETFCLEVFLSVTSLPFTHTIYTLVIHKCMWGYLERKTLDWFSTTHIPIFLRESYSFLVRNHCSLFSIPLHYHTLRGDLYPNKIHTFSKCSRCFWSCWEVLEEVKDGRCNMELVAGFGELDKTRFREALLE